MDPDQTAQEQSDPRLPCLLEKASKTFQQTNFGCDYDL